MNSFQLHRRFEAKADAKVMQKTIPAKYFRDYFSKNSKVFAFLDDLRKIRHKKDMNQVEKVQKQTKKRQVTDKAQKTFFKSREHMPYK